ncbi:methyltransferase family protein [Propionibacteriaceae bacterium ES.041]|nr:methyltransferase family protein [Propionibacteriaceae bacterium ES.041]
MERVNFFDTAVAERYDDDESAMFAPATIEATVDFLAELAGDGRVLELAIGTGRIGLPLSRRGIEVSGIELSRAMVDQLRRKPGNEAIEVTVGDMAEARVPGSFRLAYLVFNTIGNLIDQESQVACFRNAAEHLEPGGHFVIELGVPRLQDLQPGRWDLISDFSPGHVCIDRFEPLTQRLESHHWTRQDDGSFRPGFTPQRYVFPAELDLMARLAGMSLVQRWADWDRSPFTAASRKHVSVYQKG